VRKALHTGRRAYPFKNYRPVKWDIVSLPGWQPMDNAEDTLAENLAASGYQTGLVTDTLPYFAPGFNFTRGSGSGSLFVVNNKTGAEARIQFQRRG